MIKQEFFLKKIKRKKKKKKNDAKLRYHQSGRSASQRISAQASLTVIESKKYKQVNIKVEYHARKSRISCKKKQ